MTLSELIKLAVKLEKKYKDFPIKITVIDREKTSHSYSTGFTNYKYKTIDMVDLDTTGIEEEGDILKSRYKCDCCKNDKFNNPLIIVDMKDFKKLRYIEQRDGVEFEIAGNIYENKDLLEK